MGIHEKMQHRIDSIVTETPKLLQQHRKKAVAPTMEHLLQHKIENTN
jgi:hypothetical protein